MNQHNDWMSEWVSGCVGLWVNECVSEQVREDEWASERVSAKASEW